MNRFFKIALLGHLLLFLIACDAPIALSKAEAKRRALIEFEVLKDSSQLGLKEVSQDSQNHWFAVYNTVQVPSCIYMFRVENAKKMNHAISLRHKQDAFVEKLVFQDVTNDGEMELLVYLHYDYDLSFQGRELIIFKDPFDSTYHQEIFAFTLKQVWEHIESFDSMYGVPKHRKRVENHATIEFFEGKILVKGIIDGKKHHFVEFEWDDFNEGFKKILDEDLHEEVEEDEHGMVAKVKGAKVLLRIIAHEYGCKAYLIEDAGGHVLELPAHIHEALYCSRITALSDNGRYLVYTDLKKDKMLMYDFEKGVELLLVDKLAATEGVSEIAWYSAKGQQFMAFVVVNLDEYEHDTQIHYWVYNQKTDSWKSTIYDRKVIFECDFEGYCIPQKEYDFRFSESGSFLFRFKKTGNSLDDFAILKQQ